MEIWGLTTQLVSQWGLNYLISGTVGAGILYDPIRIIPLLNFYLGLPSNKSEHTKKNCSKGSD